MNSDAPVGKAPSTRRLHIAFFNRSYAPDLGATGQLLTELCEHLAHDHGHKVSVVAGPALVGARNNQGAAVGWPAGRERRNGVQVFRAWGTTFKPRMFAARALNYLSYFGSACLAGLRVRRPDVVVCLTDPPIIGLAALLTAWRSGGRFVFLCQDVFPEVARLLKDFRNETVNRILERISRFIIKKADRVIVVGESMRDYLISHRGADPARIVVIHNWADCSSIISGTKPNPFSITHGLGKSFVVMHSGNLGLSQNLDTLLDAADRLREYDDIVIALVGDGVRRAELESHARARGLTNVRFLPYQPKENLKDSFATADVFVISLKPGLAGCIVPSKLYGILAAGRPYVAAVEDSCEVTTITRKYDSGLLVEPGNPDEMAEKILALYRDPSLAQRLGTNARRAALEFDLPRQVRAYNNLFRELPCVPRLVPHPRPSFLKRPFDAILSGLGLLFSSPFWALAALLIKLEDGGPVFYANERIGKRGRCFRCWKFRSMAPGSDEKFGPLQAKERDPRVTRVGRFLRATAMDELPQLWNIFIGDMSFVGPRSLLPKETELSFGGEPKALEKIPRYEIRQQVRPGLTGIAQVYASRDIARKHKFRYDCLYIEKQDFWLDLKLIALSFWITARGKWETRERKV